MNMHRNTSRRASAGTSRRASAGASPGKAGLLRKYGSLAAPRYTSYPTAPHFHAGVDAGQYRDWLSALGPGDALSLYLHVPFCRQLCWYCGCATKVARTYGPVAEYAKILGQEIENVSRLIAGPGPVRHLHWGGGSPSRLGAGDFTRLMAMLRARFPFAADAEIAIEIDPRDLDGERISACAEAGINRASLGVQDFTPAVQKAINRIQPFELVQDRVAALRAAGIGNLNFDLMYGLPRQTVDDAENSVSLALELAPARVAVFGYAHVPWMRKHQRLLPEDALPGTEERRDQAGAMRNRLLASGYVAIGLDHFARPDDPMAIAAAAGTLRRNFQGYTTDDASTLIGLGASSIGAFPGGYIQNIADTRLYERSIRETGLAVARGIRLSADDRMRRTIIERLMCDERVDLSEIRSAYNIPAGEALAAPERLGEMEADGLLVRDGERISMTEEGKPYVRVVAALFDSFLASSLTSGKARHSGAV